MIANWLRSNVSVYVGNATAMRDFRVQLRGNRAVLLWGFYLVVLIGFAMLTYSSTAEIGSASIVEAQSRLRQFYQAIMILLAAMINLIAPALTAGAIVSERQRHSLDLVFSAPVSPKYFLVGKMVSSYRYIWMLLILSLPITSACVVLGGATWSDVISAYIILSLNALIYTAISLLISALSRQPVAAIVWSYVAAVLYSIVTGIAASMSMVSVLMGGSRSLEAPFFLTLNPYMVVQAAPTYTLLWGIEVPNWILGAAMALVIAKLLILAAGSAMSGYGAAETKSLRIHGILFSALIGALYAYAASPSFATASRVFGGTMSSARLSSTTPSWNYALDLAFALLLMPVIVLIPFLSCYGMDGQRRNWPDGTVSFRRVFAGTPSGALPYVYSLVLALFLGMAGVFGLNGGALPSMAIVFWSLALCTFFWTICRLTSSFYMGLRSARALQFTIAMGFVALPVPFFSAISAFNSSDAGIWNLYILRPMIGAVDNRSLSWIYGFILIVLSLAVVAIAETNASRKSVQSGYAT